MSSDAFQETCYIRELPISCLARYTCQVNDQTLLQRPYTIDSAPSNHLVTVSRWWDLICLGLQKWGLSTEISCAACNTWLSFPVSHARSGLPSATLQKHIKCVLRPLVYIASQTVSQIGSEESDLRIDCPYILLRWCKNCMHHVLCWAFS